MENKIGGHIAILWKKRRRLFEEFTCGVVSAKKLIANLEHINTCDKSADELDIKYVRRFAEILSDRYASGAVNKEDYRKIIGLIQDGSNIAGRC